MKFKLLDLLEFGFKNGKTSEQLSKITGISSRTVRAILSEAKLEGYGVGSDPESGFYMIDTLEDAERTLRHQFSRVSPIIQGGKAIERFCKEKFGNQIRLCEVTHEN